jgi:hypothetical protein
MKFEMENRIRTVLWVAALSLICGLIVWHVVRWHMAGLYREMFRWVGTSKGCLTALYNVLLMLALGGVLGLLMVKITDLLGYEVQEIKHFDDDNEARNASLPNTLSRN